MEKRLILNPNSILLYSNVIRRNIDVGRLTKPLQPGEVVSVGVFQNLSEHNNNREGVFYNIEAKRKNDNKDSYYLTVMSLSKYVTANELESINKYITSNEDKYSILTYNCTHLANGIWRASNGVSFGNVVSPSELYNEIKLKNGKNDTKNLKYNYAGIYYWDRSKSKLVNAVDKKMELNTY